VIADLPEVGSWERIVRPAADKFALTSELGLDTRLTPDAAKAVSEALVKMARLIDTQEAEAFAFRQSVKFVASLLAIIALLAAMVMLS
jgi:hypothetical protein